MPPADGQGASDSAAPLLRVRGVSKAFPGVQALSGINLDVQHGEVHAVLGENGAGKSTLVKILAGAYEPDDGEIEFEGVAARIRDPQHAIALGISTIHQEFNLLPDMTAAENILLGREPAGRWPGTIDRAKLHRAADELLAQIGATFSAGRRVGDLSVAEQQLVEIAKALAIDTRLIILDEPTATLTDHETERLFAIIRSLAQRGVGVIYISHRLEEARQIATRVTVLRNGKHIATVAMADIDIGGLIRLMVGRDIGERFPRTPSSPGEVVLAVEGLTRRPWFEDVSFQVRRGEILGLAGLIGAGRTELARAIFGLDKVEAGRIVIDGHEVRLGSPADAVAAGIAYLPEDRKAAGLALVRPVSENLTMTVLDRITPRGIVRQDLERRFCDAEVARLDIRAPSLATEVQYLSGGNQQKVVLGKWLARGAHIFIFDEPTRGVDVGAKVQIYHLIGQIAASGAAVIMISSELPEILGMADRIVVMAFGRVTGVLAHDEADAQKVLELAFTQRERAA